MSPANESYVECADQAGLPPGDDALDGTPVPEFYIDGTTLDNGCMVTAVAYRPW
jgi:hypothetical protein